MSGFDQMKVRSTWINGGTPNPDGHFVAPKLRALKAALNNAYQAETIVFNGQTLRCLINPERLAEDYDQKTISIPFDSGMKCGDTFYWTRTGCHWITYLRKHEEEAYFRARIRRCDYSILVNGVEYWVYVRGPIEQSTQWSTTHQISFNDLNYSLLMYVTKDEDTLEFFSRHNKVKFNGHNWVVAATDKYSQEGIIEVYLKESFDNDLEDDMVQLKPVEPDASAPYIDGLQIVRPYDTITYSIVGLDDGVFKIDTKKAIITSSNNKTCTIEIISGKSGKFDLVYQSPTAASDIILAVNIKSL